MPCFFCLTLGLFKKLFWCALNHTVLYTTLEVLRSICPLLHTPKVIRLSVWERKSPAQPGTALRWCLFPQLPQGVRLQEPLLGVVGWILSQQNSLVEILISGISECLFGNRLITEIINKDEVLLESGEPWSNMIGAFIKSLNTNLEIWTELHTHTQYVNRELPDIQARFRKGRGTRDQIVNIHWTIEKAREFQKNIYFCLLIMPKPLTV